MEVKRKKRENIEKVEMARGRVVTQDCRTSQNNKDCDLSHLIDEYSISTAQDLVCRHRQTGIALFAELEESLGFVRHEMHTEHCRLVRARCRILQSVSSIDANWRALWTARSGRYVYA